MFCKHGLVWIHASQATEHTHGALLLFSVQVLETRVYSYIQHPSQQELNAAANGLIYCKRRAAVYPVISRQNNGQILAIQRVIDFYQCIQPNALKWDVNKLSLECDVIPATTAIAYYLLFSHWKGQTRCSGFSDAYMGADKSLARPDWKKQFQGPHFWSNAGVIAAAETWLDGQTFEFFFEWLAKVRVWSL